MKVLILSNSSEGLYGFRQELLVELVKKNEVLVLSPDDGYKSNIEELGIDFINMDLDRHGKNLLKEFLLFNKYKSYIKKINPDVVLTYTIKPTIYGGLACKFMKIPFIVNITGWGCGVEHGGFLKRIIIKLYKFVLPSAQKVFFQNKSNLLFALNKKMLNYNYMLIPGSGVNLDKYTYKEYPETNEKLNFVIIGRLMKEKGIYDLIKGIEIVKEKYPDVDFNLVGDYDGDCKDFVEKAIRLNFVNHFGYQKNVIPYIEKSFAIIHPSHFEGMANVLLESAACGRPIIASNIPGCMETFEENVSGYGFEVQNPKDLADKIIKFIELPHTKKREMGKMGRIKVENEFDRRIIVNAYLEEIDKLEERKRK